MRIRSSSRESALPGGEAYRGDPREPGRRRAPNPRASGGGAPCRDLALRLNEVPDHLVEVLAVLAGHGRVAGEHDAVLHDPVAGGEAVGLDPVLVAAEHRMARDVPGEDDAAHDPGVLELDLELAAAPSRLRPELDRVAEPGGLGLREDRRQQEELRVARQELAVPAEAFLAQRPEPRDLVHLLDAEGGAALVRDEAVGVL